MKKVTLLVAAGLMAVSSVAMAEKVIHKPNSVVAFAASVTEKGSAISFYRAKTEAEARAKALESCNNDNVKNNLGGTCKVEYVFTKGCEYATITNDNAQVKTWVLGSSYNNMRALCEEHGLDCKEAYISSCNAYLGE